MGAVGASRPMDGHEPSIDDSQQLLQLCHDLRQYVAAGLLLSEPAPGGSNGRMDLIHQQFRAIAELLEGEQEPGHRSSGVNLARLADECAGVVRLTHRVPVISDRLVRVQVIADRALLRRAVGNLLDNACRAAGPAGTVTIRVGTEDADAWIEVCDDGPGFGGVTSHTGHGLHVVAAAVRSCGGRLEIRTEPGTGTTVRLCMPAAHRRVRSA